MASKSSTKTSQDDQLEEIFSWLPPESLIRFKCVSKSWYTLIHYLMKNPRFVKKHLHNVQKKLLPSTCLVFYCPPKRVPECHLVPGAIPLSLLTIFHDYNESSQINYVSEDFRFPTPWNKLDIQSAHRSHCNGIICLAFYRDVILYNPAINECRTLPKPCSLYGCRNFFMQGIGFGYDLRDNDYKFVRFGTDKTTNQKFAELYSMRTNSWREIRINVEIYRSDLGNGVFCKGVFYWSSQTHIISFDLFDEVFHSMPVPSNLLTCDGIKVAVWNDSVAFFLYHAERFIQKPIQMWVMDDCAGGVNSYWIHKLTIEPLVDNATPLTFWKNDELLMKADNGVMISYNLHSQTLSFFTFKPGKNSICLYFDNYVKSLVSVQNGS